MIHFDWKRHLSGASCLRTISCSVDEPVHLKHAANIIRNSKMNTYKYSIAELWRSAPNDTNPSQLMDIWIQIQHDNWLSSDLSQTFQPHGHRDRSSLRPLTWVYLFHVAAVRSQRSREESVPSGDQWCAEKCWFPLSHFMHLLLPFRVQNVVSTSMRAKLAAYSLALLLHMGHMTVDLTLLHCDLGITEAR